MAVALAAASAVLLLVLLERLTGRRWAWILTLAYALGTANWSTSSQALWQHTFGAVAIIGCLYCLDREWFWTCGAYAGWALMIRPTNIVLLPALILALWPRARPCSKFLTAPLVALVLLAAYNYKAFGSVAGGYPIRLTGDFLAGMSGILISPGRGLLIYTPLVAFALCAFFPPSRDSTRNHRPLFIAATLFALLQLATVAKWETWWGGYCWGPRLLTELLPPSMVLIALGVPAITAYRLKNAFLGVTAYCCLIQVLGAFFYPKGHWDNMPVSVNAAPARLWIWRDNPILRTAQGGLAWEPYAIIWTAATKGLPAATQKLRETGIHPY